VEEVEAPPGLGEQVTAEEEKEAQMEEVEEKTAIEEPENKVEENVAEDLAENETEDTEGKEGSLTSSVTDSEGSSLVETWTLVDREDAQPEEKVEEEASTKEEDVEKEERAPIGEKTSRLASPCLTPCHPASS